MSKHDLPTLNEILNGDLQPWLFESINQDQFKDHTDDLQEYESNYTAKYQIKYQKPFNAKTRYYQKLISIELSKSLDKLIDLLADSHPFEYRKYWYTEIMNMLHTRLKDIGSQIMTRKLHLESINPSQTNFHEKTDLKADIFTIHLLKLAFMQLLLEVQECYPELQDEVYSEEELYMEFTAEPVPDSPFIMPVITIDQQPTTNIKKPKKESSRHLHSFKYNNYPNDQGALANLRNSLIKADLINHLTSLAQVRRIFSGEQVEEPIKWTGNPSELSYFIKLLHEDYIQNLGQNLWTVALKCFTDESGNSFERKIRKLPTPKLSEATIQKCVSNLQALAT